MIFSPALALRATVWGIYTNFISLLTFCGDLGIIMVLNFMIPYRKCLENA